MIVDLAVERGGNVEGAKPGEIVEAGGVKIVGYLNVPGRIAASASALYARNLYAFVETLIDKANKQVAVDWDDELVKATNLTRDGAIVHPAFAGKAGEEAMAELTPEQAVEQARAAAQVARDAADQAPGALPTSSRRAPATPPTPSPAARSIPSSSSCRSSSSRSSSATTSSGRSRRRCTPR